MRFLTVLNFVLVCCLFVARSHEAGAGHGVFNPETFTLENGMQVVVVSNHRMPVVTHMVWYKTGSADEPAGKTGVAHLLEHLMFKATKNLPSGEFSRRVARVGGSENAFTSRDYTGYYQTVAVQHLEAMMTMEADRMRNLVLDKEEVDTERMVVLEERRQRTDNDPGAILREHVNAAMYLNYPYRQPVIGWDHEIRGLTVQDLRDFYQHWYTPGNAILVVAGDITAEQLKPLAEKTYGQIPSFPKVERQRPQEPKQTASRRVMLRDARVRQPSLSRMFMAPSVVTPVTDGAGTEHSYALDVLSNIVGGGATSQIYRSLVVEKKLAVSAGGGYSSDSLGPGQFYFYASPAPGIAMAQLEEALTEELAALIRDGVKQADVDRVKKSMLAEAVYARDSLSGGARTLGSALASGMSIEDVESWPHRIEQVGVEQVNAAIKAVFEDKPSVVALLLGEKDQ